MVHMAAPPTGVFSGPRFNELLAQYIAACGGPGYTWIQHVDAKWCFNYDHLDRFNVPSARIPPNCTERYMARTMANLLLDTLIVVACTERRQIIAPVETAWCDMRENALYISASFLHYGDARARYDMTHEEERNIRQMIFDAYRCRKVRFAPFDDIWLF